MAETFQIGDTVRWSSQASAYRKTKQGEVVAVVKPGMRPDEHLFSDLYRSRDCGLGRREESYVVRAGKKHYWPRTIKLQLVSSKSA